MKGWSRDVALSAGSSLHHPDFTPSKPSVRTNHVSGVGGSRTASASSRGMRSIAKSAATAREMAPQSSRLLEAIPRRPTPVRCAESHPTATARPAAAPGPSCKQQLGSGPKVFRSRGLAVGPGRPRSCKQQLGLGASLYPASSCVSGPGRQRLANNIPLVCRPPWPDTPDICRIANVSNSGSGSV